MGGSGPELDPRAPSVASRLHGEHSTPAQVRATRRSVSRRRGPYSEPDRSLVRAASGQVSRLCDDFARALGFGGLHVTRALDRADVEVTLVDRANHPLFQPLLYQVAT